MQEENSDPKQREIDLAWQAHIAEEETDAELRRRWLLFYVEHQDQKCAYCNVPLLIGKVLGLEDRQATIDHIVPKSLGGEDIPSNTLAACAYCNNLKGSSKLSDFLIDPELVTRILKTSECPHHISSDPSSKHYDAESIARGISVTVDHREFTNVYEYCVPENWVKLRLEKTKARNGQPMTALKRGKVSVIYLDTRDRLRAMEDGMRYVDHFKQLLLERSQPC
jgi:5-methylcytosine-specific restriction endonuclease McrA